MLARGRQIEVVSQLLRKILSAMNDIVCVGLCIASCIVDLVERSQMIEATCGYRIYRQKASIIMMEDETWFMFSYCSIRLHVLIIRIER